MAQSVAHTIEAILFDVNGTLRVREPHGPTQQAAFARLCQLLKKENTSESYWELLARRQKAYTHWAQENTLQLSEAEIWTQWILPDLPRERIEQVAPELTLAWGECKGRSVPKQGAGETILALKQRGYRLGVISNTMSTLDIPSSLDAFGWTDHLDVVVLSSQVKWRKPAPEPFLYAAQKLGIPPGRCAYLGNRVSKDVLGCKRAGYALGIVLESPGGSRPEDADQPVKPDMIIHSLIELLEYFPGRGN